MQISAERQLRSLLPRWRAKALRAQLAQRGEPSLELPQGSVWRSDPHEHWLRMMKANRSGIGSLGAARSEGVAGLLAAEQHTIAAKTRPVSGLSIGERQGCSPPPLYFKSNMKDAFTGVISRAADLDMTIAPPASEPSPLVRTPHGLEIFGSEIAYRSIERQAPHPPIRYRGPILSAALTQDPTFPIAGHGVRRSQMGHHDSLTPCAARMSQNFVV